MKGVCLNCEEETEIKRVCAREIVEVRGKPSDLDTGFFNCKA